MSENACRVLVADDEPAVRRLSQIFLARAGYRVTEASDGQDALEKLSASTFDVILLDLQMPRLDGIGLLHQLRAWRPALLSRVIVLSSSGGELPEDLRAQVFRTIQKPAGSDDLVAAVTACARR